jgi:hypothetical protein
VLISLTPLQYHHNLKKSLNPELNFKKPQESIIFQFEQTVVGCQIFLIYLEKNPELLVAIIFQFEIFQPAKTVGFSDGQHGHAHQFAQGHGTQHGQPMNREAVAIRSSRTES